MFLHQFYTLVQQRRDSLKAEITHDGALRLADGADQRLEQRAIAQVGASLVDAAGDAPFTETTFVAEVDAYISLSGLDATDRLLRGEAIAKIIEPLNPPA